MRKRNLIFAVILTLLLCLTACSQQSDIETSTRSYEHISFASSVEKDNCLLCGDNSDHKIGAYMGQDNVGLVDINTFELIPVEINRYSSSGQILEEATGVMTMTSSKIGNTSAWQMTDVDRGYSHIQISPSDTEIDTAAAASFFCQDCLDVFASRFFEDDRVSEIAIINFTTKDIRPLVETCPWFAFDNYLVDCTFKDDGGINLQITYRPVRYREQE